MGNGLTEWIVRNREPLELSQDVAATVAGWGINVTGDMPRSYLGVPLLVGDRVIGAMAVQDYERDDAYRPGPPAPVRHHRRPDRRGDRERHPL